MIFESLLFFIIICVIIVGVQKVWQSRHPDVGLNGKQLIQKYGYPFENHTVQSDDGYLLEVHRIPPMDKKNAHNRPPILIMPGFMSSSADWVNMGATNSLGFILATEGYDVWLINYRGTTWSKNHTKLDCKRDKEKFFDFSFQEIGYYDLPACIDYVLNVTQQENLFYIGHSQATTSYFALLSDKPNYNEKIRLTIALSPFVSAKQSKSSFYRFLISTIQGIIRFVVKTLNWHEIMPSSKSLMVISQILCYKFSPFKYACPYVFYSFAGFTTQMKESIIPIIVSNTPAGSSYKQIEHFYQLYKGQFRKYDYGEVKNIEKYGQPTPPEYDLSKSKVPIAVFYGSNDAIVHPKGVQYLISKLPNVVMKKLIPGFNHIDVIWGTDAPELIFRDIIKLIKSHS